jgi:hypothetical protein
VRAALPDVEAVLVRKNQNAAGGLDAFIVPIDACYDLVGRIRTLWSGFDGGGEVRAQIQGFFDDVVSRAAVGESLAGRS